MRDFLKERYQQRILEELDKVLRKIRAPPEVIALYRQNPLLALLLKKAVHNADR